MSSAPRYLVRKGRASVPAPTAISDALRGHAALAQLGSRLEASRQRLQLIEVLLPPPMRTHLQAGPVDEEGWTLLVASSAVAAKLRQLLPRLEERLHQAGIRPARIRVRMLQR